MKKPFHGAVILVLIVMAATGCLPKAADCKLPEVFCVGLVTDGGQRDDRAYNQAAWEGIQQAKTSGVADLVASIETVDARDFEENIGVFAEAGYDVIVTVESGMSEATLAAAKAYPNTFFIG